VVLVVVLSALLVLFLGYAWYRRRGRILTVSSETLAPTPDLGEDDVEADALPVERWITLAQELREKGSLRLALRALYLAILAHLAARDMITVAKYKSNGEYKKELNRRAHEREELVTRFSKLVALFDRAWYGMHPVTRDELDRFNANRERIMTIA
jgi:hypothetical protein